MNFFNHRKCLNGGYLNGTSIQVGVLMVALELLNDKNECLPWYFPIPL